MVNYDPVTLEVARNRMSAIADDMGAVLRRTAYSPNIKERADCSAAIFTAKGEMLAQAEHIPVHLGSMPASVIAVLDMTGGTVEAGAQYAMNDPFAGGTHLNDLTLVRGVFVEGEMIGFVANRAHHADVGGEAPGSMPAHAVRLDQEGHIISSQVAVRDGEWCPEFLEPFLAATRTPEERIGDLSAQLGANEAGAKRLADEARGNLAAFLSVSDQQLDYGERRMADALSAMPDGTYRFVDYMEWGERDIPIEVAVTIDGPTLHADFAGSSPQIEANFNAVAAVTLSCLYYAVRVAADPAIPANEGSYRGISLAAPSGSLVNASSPAAVAAGNVETSQRIADVVLGALAQAAPAMVPAASQGTMNNVLIGNEGFAYYETVGGGQGGRPTKPGQSGIQTGMTNTKNTPIESLESHYPFRVLRYGLRSGSGGEGRFGGGEGIIRHLEFLEPVTVSLMGERRRLQPWGLQGGSPGKCGEDWLITKRGVRHRLDSKVTFDAAPGDQLFVMTPGGGGWGN